MGIILNEMPVGNSRKHKKNQKAKKSYKAIFNSAEFGEKDLQELYDLDWEITEIYQVVEHIGLLEKNRRIIIAFLKK